VGLDIQVQWHSGEQGEIVPERFSLGGHEVQVSEVVDRWPGSGYGYVKVRGDDRGCYILRHEEGAKRWSVTLYDSGELETTRLSS
jgi:hypothetical protein